MDSVLTLIRQDWDYSVEDNPDPDESGLEVPGTLGSIGRRTGTMPVGKGSDPALCLPQRWSTILVNGKPVWAESDMQSTEPTLPAMRIELYLEERAGVCDEDSTD